MNSSPPPRIAKVRGAGISMFDVFVARSQARRDPAAEDEER
ncbi:hypothetical protein OH787_05430 [Streptomyces sp. NBC_01547]